jgi:sugar phosphate permease
VAITGACILGLAFISEVWHFYLLLVFARAFSSSAAMMAATVAVANWFVRKRGRAMAVSNSGTWIAIPLFVMGSQFLIASYDWRWAMFVMGVSSLVLAIPATLIFMKRRPEDIGLLPDGDSLTPSPEEKSGRRRQQPIDASWSLREAMHTKALWLIILATGLPSMAAQAANLHALASLTDRGIPAATAAGTVTVTLLVSGVGTVFWGLLAERLHVRFTAALAFLISGLGLAILIYADTVAMAFFYAAVYGLGFGGFRVLENMLFADYFGRRRLGTIAGFAKPFHLATNVAGPLLASLSFDIRGSYTPAFVLFSLAYVTASIALLLATPPKKKPAEGTTA